MYYGLKEIKVASLHRKYLMGKKQNEKTRMFEI